MKYAKSIVAFLLLNLVMVFLMIFIANKTREIEKNNSNLKVQISKITKDIKINKIEFITHQNTNYLKNLYSMYLFEKNDNYIPKIITIEQLLKKDQNIKLVKTNN